MGTINEVLRNARKSLGLKQEFVAEVVSKKLGESFTNAALAQIELGQTKFPRPKNLHAICDVLGIDSREALKGRLVWLGQTVEEGNAGYSANLRLEEHQRMALQLLDKLSPAQRAEWFAWAVKQDQQNQDVKAWLLEQAEDRKAV